MNRTFFQAQKWAFSFIKDNPELDESGVTMLLCGQMNWSQTDLLLNLRQPISDSEWQKFKANVEQYQAGWPVQYILGKAEFFGLTLKVTPDTLIPRLETEELVEWILTDFSQMQGLNVLDIGTGSGAIGLALKHEQPTWKVTLADLSGKALSIARENALKLNLNVDTIESDLFEKIKQPYDIIVSNPPYIAEDEKQFMDQSVLEHEPQMALFAAQNGLAIYQRIALECQQNIKANSVIYLEIGFNQGQRVSQIFHQAFPRAEITVKKDIAGHDRMVRIKLKKG